MPEQLLAPEPADPEHDQEPKTGTGEAIDMTALRALRASRTDVEALDFTADRLRQLQEKFAKAGDAARARARADRSGPVRADAPQAHSSQELGPHQGREAGL